MDVETACQILATMFPQALIRTAKVLERNAKSKKGDWTKRGAWYFQEHARDHLLSMEKPGPNKELDPDHAAVRCLMLLQALYGFTITKPEEFPKPLSKSQRSRMAKMVG